MFGADKDTDLSYTYDVKAFTKDTPSSPSKVCPVLAWLFVRGGASKALTQVAGMCQNQGAHLQIGRMPVQPVSLNVQSMKSLLSCDYSQIELGPGDGTVNKRSLEACSQLGPRVRVLTLRPCRGLGSFVMLRFRSSSA